MERERRPVFRASIGEILGSWLRVWTPRRDVYVPPVPVFRILLGVVLLVGAIVVTTVLVENGKEAGRERDRRDEAAAAARIRVRVAREQVPRRARLGEPAQSHVRTQHALEAAITRDSQERFAHRALDNRVTHTTCIPFLRPTVPHPPQPPPGAASGKYECLGVTTSVGPTPGTRGGDFGYPFWARVDFRHGTAVWCKINPRPGELGVGGDVFVPLAPACDLLAR